MNYFLSIFILFLACLSGISSSAMDRITLKSFDNKEIKLSLTAARKSHTISALADDFVKDAPQTIIVERSGTVLDATAKVLTLLDKCKEDENINEKIIKIIESYDIYEIFEVAHYLDIPELVRACLDLYCQKINGKLSNYDYDLESLLGPLMVDEYIQPLSNLEHYNPGYTVDRNWANDLARYYMNHYGSNLDIPKFISMHSALWKFNELLSCQNIGNLKVKLSSGFMD